MEKTVIILDGRKFDWLEHEINKFKSYWNMYRRYSSDTIMITKQIAQDMEEDADDILLLALDQARKGQIK